MKIFIKKKSKSKTGAKMISTACQDYSPDMKEYVFAIKGRPFAMLSSQKLPVPPVSLIDFNLVRDLGLEMQDLQCTKYTFAGMKLRILGRVSQTLQTIQEGAISGTAHVRANVVENLYQAFDTHSIAGQQMLAALQEPPTRPESEESPPSPRSPRPTSSSGSRSSTASNSPAPDFSAARFLSSYMPSSPSAAALNNHGARGRKSPLKNRSQPRREHQVPEENFFNGRVIEHKALTCAFAKARSLLKVLYQSEDGLRLDTKTLYDHDGEPFPDHYKTLESGDAVMCRTVEVPGWPYNPDFYIDKFVNKREEKVYRLTGETFPEVPPDLHPNGYYG